MQVRGDQVGYFDGIEDGASWTALAGYLKKADTILSELQPITDGLANVRNRSNAMTTVYPGNATHYVSS